jgi:Zn-dependent peptidase ImmA (M78 family)
MSLTKAAAMKSFWKTSMQSLIVRAHQLGKISDDQYAFMFRQLSARGYKKCEPVPIPPEEPEMFQALIDFHRNSVRRSLRELSDFLGEPEENFVLSYGRNFLEYGLVS